MNQRDPDHVIKTGEQSADDPFTFVLSSERADRVGDIIRQDGWMLSQFKKNPIALFGHEHDFPIGTWSRVRVEGKRLLGELKLAAAGTSQRIDEIRSLVEQRVLRAVSVGFRIKDYDPIDKDEPWGGWDIKQAELFETSLVSVPANPDALAVVKTLHISSDTQKLIFDRMSADRTCRAMEGDNRQHDYSDLLGDHSDLVRSRKRLVRAGML